VGAGHVVSRSAHRHQQVFGDLVPPLDRPRHHHRELVPTDPKCLAVRRQRTTDVRGDGSQQLVAP
jgi:hypothetical protein